MRTERRVGRMSRVTGDGCTEQTMDGGTHATCGACGTRRKRCGGRDETG